jgi:hypothetical protein
MVGTIRFQTTLAVGTIRPAFGPRLNRGSGWSALSPGPVIGFAGDSRHPD